MVTGAMLSPKLAAGQLSSHTVAEVEGTGSNCREASTPGLQPDRSASVDSRGLLKPLQPSWHAGVDRERAGRGARHRRVWVPTSLPSNLRACICHDRSDSHQGICRQWGIQPLAPANHMPRFGILPLVWYGPKYLVEVGAGHINWSFYEMSVGDLFYFVLLLS